MSGDTAELRPAALVFGGSRGIGAAAAKRLAEAGFRVALTYAARADKAEDVVTAIRRQGGEAFAIQADSADSAAIRSAVSQATERFGAISVVVVNAGIFKMATLDEVTLEDLDQMIAINVRGVFLSIQIPVPHMADGGRVITIGSNVAIRTGLPGSSVYQFTKAAVAAMVKGLALDLAPRRITVNNIQPGPTNTDLNAGLLEMLSSMSPLKGVADPTEIAGAVSYLARSESGYMTGASLTIDGGFVL